MLDFVTNLIGDAQITNAQGKESDVCQKAIFLNNVENRSKDRKNKIGLFSTRKGVFEEYLDEKIAF